MVSEEQAYTNLANAIIQKACEDYKMALKCNAESLQKNIEKFFLSEYFEVLTNIDGKMLIRKLKEQVKNH